jgi:hypothetical protein
VRNSSSLVEVLEAYTNQHQADLIIMGSQTLASGGGGTSSNGSTAVPMGSVALTCLRQLQRPLLVVKANAKLAAVQWDKDKLRVMVAVDHAAKSVLMLACDMLVNGGRGDQLFLARLKGVVKGQVRLGGGRGKVEGLKWNPFIMGGK